jgi:hypothetical protein
MTEGPVNATPRKYCSQRCKKISKMPLRHVAEVWRDILLPVDKDHSPNTRGGQGEVVLCVEVQAMVFDEKTAREIGPRGHQSEKDESGEMSDMDGVGEIGETGENKESGVDVDVDVEADSNPTQRSYPACSPPATPQRNAQQLGMVHARNRETVRSAARLIYHYGFEHFFTFDSSTDANAEMKPRDNERMSMEKAVEYPVEAMRKDGRVVTDVTHAKGEWGLRLKKR